MTIADRLRIGYGVGRMSKDMSLYGGLDLAMRIRSILANQHPVEMESFGQFIQGVGRLAVKTLKMPI